MDADRLRYLTNLSRNWKQITKEILELEENPVCVDKNEMIQFIALFKKKVPESPDFTTVA